MAGFSNVKVWDRKLSYDWNRISVAILADLKGYFRKRQHGARCPEEAKADVPKQYMGSLES